MKFKLTEYQEKLFMEWKSKNNFTDGDAGMAGGSFVFKFIPTGIGTIISVEHISGEILELTEWKYFD